MAGPCEIVLSTVAVLLLQSVIAISTDEIWITPPAALAEGLEETLELTCHYPGSDNVF